MIDLRWSRRNFLKSIVHVGLLWVTSPFQKVTAQTDKTGSILSGTEFDLVIANTEVNITGEQKIATTINGMLPGPTLRWREGDTVTLRVKNLLNEETSIHWHGIILPYQMDGAPQISFDGIAPGETFTYQFKVQQAGSYWYHSHSEMQEQTGLYGAIVIDPINPNSIQADRDYVLLLSDWTNEDPLTVYANLKKDSTYYNPNQPTLVQLVQDIAKDGLKAAFEQRHMWNKMRMSRTDLSDITALTYTYLLNGHSKQGWTGLFKPGETIRLRFINAAAQSFFDVRIPGLKMTVVAADGQLIEPVEVDEFRIGLAENYDVLVTPTDSAYTVFAQSMDRTGFVSGTLVTQYGLTAPVPDMDKPVPLAMQDMMGAMNHQQHANMDHSMHHNMHNMSHDMPDMVSSTVHHPETENAASVDMQVDQPRTNLDDPGVGLRQNGRRVLVYADLRSIQGLVPDRLPTRELELHLTGNMGRYTWSFDGVSYSHADRVHFKYGEQLRIILVNDTMMTHPIHLHGMWSDLENEHGQLQVRKHTIVVQPAQKVAFRVNANALGRWPWHCHLFYHMHAGMFREVVVS